MLLVRLGGQLHHINSNYTSIPNTESNYVLKNTKSKLINIYLFTDLWCWPVHPPKTMFILRKFPPHIIHISIFHKVCRLFMCHYKLHWYIAESIFLFHSYSFEIYTYTPVYRSQSCHNNLCYRLISTAEQARTLLIMSVTIADTPHLLRSIYPDTPTPLNVTYSIWVAPKSITEHLVNMALYKFGIL